MIEHISLRCRDSRASRKFYERALEPKSLVIIEGKHFDAYTEPGLSLSAPPAVEWFERHLMWRERRRAGEAIS